MAVAFKTDLPTPAATLRHHATRLHDAAYAYLKGLLLDGQLRPGDQISSEGIGRVLSMSRAPVSDAIRRLTVEGLLEVLPQIGCRVVTPVPTEVADFYELFGASEGVLVRMAALRRTPDEATALRDLVRTLGRRADLSPRERNRIRYERLHQLAGTPLSASIAEAFWDRSDFYLAIAWRGRPHPGYIAAGHIALIDAIAQGDGEKAEHTIREMFFRLGRDVADQLEADQDATPTATAPRHLGAGE